MPRRRRGCYQADGLIGFLSESKTSRRNFWKPKSNFLADEAPDCGLWPSDTRRRAIRPLLPSGRFFDREMLPDINTVKSADAVCNRPNALSHKFYYRIIDPVRKETISVRYFGSASAGKCAEQLVADEMAASE